LVLPAGTRVGVTVILPIPTRVAAPPTAVSTSTVKPAQSVAHPTRLTIPAAI
jgi:hypothetical protein